MKKSLIVLLLGFTFSIIKAQEPAEIVDNFFKIYKEKDSAAAIKYMTSTNIWLENDTIKPENWLKQLNQAATAKGKYCGYEIIETTETGTSFVQIECLVKYEKTPFIISVILYKPKLSWQVNNINVGRNKQANKKQFRR